MGNRHWTFHITIRPDVLGLALAVVLLIGASSGKMVSVMARAGSILCVRGTSHSAVLDLYRLIPAFPQLEFSFRERHPVGQSFAIPFGCANRGADAEYRPPMCREILAPVASLAWDRGILEGGRGAGPQSPQRFTYLTHAYCRAACAAAYGNDVTSGPAENPTALAAPNTLADMTGLRHHRGAKTYAPYEILYFALWRSSTMIITFFIQKTIGCPVVEAGWAAIR